MRSAVHILFCIYIYIYILTVHIYLSMKLLLFYVTVWFDLKINFTPDFSLHGKTAAAVTVLKEHGAFSLNSDNEPLCMHFRALFIWWVGSPVSAVCRWNDRVCAKMRDCVFMGVTMHVCVSGCTEVFFYNINLCAVDLNSQHTSC